MGEPINEVAMLEAALEQGLQLRRAGQGEAALDVLDLILGHFGTADHPAAHLKLASARLNQDDPAAAIVALDTLLARWPEGRDSALRHWLEEGRRMRAAL